MEYGSGLQTALTYGVIVLLGLVVAMFVLLVVLRLVASRRERRLENRKLQILSVVTGLLDSDVMPEDAARTLRDVVPSRDRRPMELALLELAPNAKGGRAERLSFLCERLGFIQKDIDDLEDGRPSRKAEAAFHLGMVGSERAVGPLLRTLDSNPDQGIVFACLNALSHIGTPEAIEGVAGYLASHDELENVRIAEVLLERGKEFSPYIRTWLEEGGIDSRRLNFLLKVTAALDDASMVAPVSGYLGHDDPEVRANAARALGMLGERAACGQLARMMEDGSVRVRAEAAEALGLAGCAEALGVLEAGLGDPDMGVRRSCASALMLLGSEGRAALERYAAAAEEEEREAAAEVLETERVRNSRKGA